MLTGILTKIGLNAKESQVYLSLLELGSQPASVIGKKANINRSTTYLILDALIQKGYVNEHVRADVKYFAAADPQVIVQSLEQQEHTIDENRKELIDLLPDFYSLTNPLSIKPKVRFYEGEEGVKRAMNDTLNSSEPLYSWCAFDSWLKVTPSLHKYIKDYAKLRAEKYKIPVRVIVPDKPEVRDYLLHDYPPLQDNKNPLMEIRWLPKDIPAFNNETNIYDDKVSIVSLAKNELHGVVIESHEIAQLHKAMFQMAWKAGKKT
jgi:HTH-type transcriptional regulator, sugar sensing transcriptional regulator